MGNAASGYFSSCGFDMRGCVGLIALVGGWWLTGDALVGAFGGFWGGFLVISDSCGVVII